MMMTTIAVVVVVVVCMRWWRVYGEVFREASPSYHQPSIKSSSSGKGGGGDSSGFVSEYSLSIR